jgi:hypothetical protein
LDTLFQESLISYINIIEEGDWTTLSNQVNSAEKEFTEHRNFYNYLKLKRAFEANHFYGPREVEPKRDGSKKKQLKVRKVESFDEYITKITDF